MGPALRILLALLGGIALGAMLRATGSGGLDPLLTIADPVGGLWLSALRMCIVPLVFALVITGIAAASDRSAAGGVAGRSLGLMIGLLVVSALLSVALFPLILQFAAISPDSAASLRAVGDGSAHVPASASASGWWQGIVPVNPIQAAAEGSMLPLVVFALALGFACTAIDAAARDRLVGFFQALADALLVIVHWVLGLAPIGVFALAFQLGARTGLGAAGALVHYVLVLVALMTVLAGTAYAVAVVGARCSIGRFARAVVPAQAVAASTQSSLASLPAMVEACAGPLHVAPRVASLVLPLAVSVFRFSSPGVNLAVALYGAHLYGIHPDALQLSSAVALAVLTSMAAVSLPGQLTFYMTATPLWLVFGLPLDILPLLLAVEAIPDIFRTVVNVTADVAVTAVTDRVFSGGAVDHSAMQG